MRVNVKLLKRKTDTLFKCYALRLRFIFAIFAHVQCARYIINVCQCVVSHMHSSVTTVIRATCVNYIQARSVSSLCQVRYRLSKENGRVRDRQRQS